LLIGASVFVILTDVDGAYLNYGTPKQTLIKQTTAQQLEQYMKEGRSEPSEPSIDWSWAASSRASLRGRSVTVPTGPFPAARLLEEEPDFIVSSFREVPGLVRRLDC